MVPKRKLVGWWRRHGRDYPWRYQRDPYVLAVTELMLVRTKADQVVRVWGRFFRRFPTVTRLAGASEGQVEDVLAPLGLRWRASRVRDLAHQATDSYGGTVPATAELLSQMVPAGDYLPAAVALQVSGRGKLPVDTGIARFLTRYFGLATSKEARRAGVVRHASKLTGEWRRKEFYALVDLVRYVCVSGNPLCGECPVAGSCTFSQRERLRNA